MNGQRTSLGAVPAQSDLIDALFDSPAAREQAHAQLRLGEMPPLPARRLVVVTCMDVRVDPVRILGLVPGDAHILRNAGARVGDDVLRSLAVSTAMMGTTEVVVCHHTDCGLNKATPSEVEAAIVAASGQRCALDLKMIEDPDAALWQDCGVVLDCDFLPPLIVSGVRFDVFTGGIDLVVPPARRPEAAAS